MARAIALSTRQAQALGLVASPRRNKYGVRLDRAGVDGRTVDGITFDSKAEATRYGQLVLAERAGEIYRLERQRVFPFVVNGMQIGAYRADFAYLLPGGVQVVEDVKSPATARLSTFRLKRALMLACYGITIREVRT